MCRPGRVGSRRRRPCAVPRPPSPCASAPCVFRMVRWLSPGWPRTPDPAPRCGSTAVPKGRSGRAPPPTERRVQMRIRWQSFIEPSRHRQYFELLDAQLESCFDEGTVHEIVGIDPPDTMLHRLTETRCGMRAVANAVAAEADGCDAFLIGHFQDSGLHEARSAVDIPVLGLGETSMLHACTLGQRIGLVTINPIFIAWHQDQIVRYGLRERVIGVTAMTGLMVEDYVSACQEADAFSRVLGQFERAA